MSKSVKKYEDFDDDPTKFCVVCCRDILIFAVGICDHPVCHECSTRMRVLCFKNECPICRGNMPSVYFTLHLQEYIVLANNGPNGYYYHERDYSIYFENSVTKKKYDSLLQSFCKECDLNFPNFKQLKDHMRKDHELFYCDLCLDSLKIFPFERKCYSRKELALHKRQGDPDDTSHRGHPPCKFCNTRYVDDDELFRHMRREHFFCHFCDADGYHQYYNVYEDLRLHFGESHYLCEEGGCAEEKFTSVFRSSIDLQAHRAQYHSKTMSKHQAKQARTLELEFTIKPRSMHQNNVKVTMREDHDNKRGRRSMGKYPEKPERESQDEVAENFSSQVKINTNCEKEFPCLSNNSVPGDSFGPRGVSMADRLNKGYKAYESTSGDPAAPSDEFPALAPSYYTKPQVTVRTMPSNSQNRVTVHFNDNDKSKGASNVSIQLTSGDNYSSNPLFSKSVYGPRVKDFDAEFPVLETKAPMRSSATTTVTIPIKEPVNSGAFSSVTIKSKSNKKKKSKAEQSDSAESMNGNDPYDNRTNSAYLIHSSRSILPQNIYEPKGVTEPNVKVVPAVSESNNVPTSKPSQKPVKNFGIDDFPPLANPKENKSKSKLYELESNNIKVANSWVPPPTLNNEKENSNFNISLSSVASQLTKPTTNNLKPPPGLENMNPLHLSYVYLHPENFQERNLSLISAIQESLNRNEHGYTRFKQLSVQFRKSLITAEQYHNECLDILGRKGFLEILPELLVLLPDIDKQQELLKAHHSFRDTGTKNNQWNTAGYCQFSVCAKCQQVLVGKDFKVHMAQHNQN